MDFRLITRTRDRLKTWFWCMNEKSVFLKGEKRYLFVGDKAPDSLINRKPGTNIGAMISIDPETHIITAIFIP